ncbi:hypothetical protein KBD61_06480 [Patescibacteria group bacterium]|nr:hypothetical protein [Patescibacteria group bacterium]MBP9710630.1 hypothetical protein [Patescibacteria group bacterium]
MFQIILEPSTPVIQELPTSPADKQASAIFGLFITGVVVVTLFGIGIYRLMRLLRRPELHGTSREQILKRWEQIEHTATQGVMGSKLAIIEADKLLDQVLRSMAMPGSTLGERLKSTAYQYPNIRKVWSAHRLRNQLVHDTSFEMASRQARLALDDYKAALKVLNVM